MSKTKVTAKGIWEVTKNTFSGFSNDKVTKLSASLAYYTVFSMGPLMVVLISLCAIFFKRDVVEGKVYATLRSFVGQDTAVQLQEIIKNAAVSNKGAIAATIGIIALLIGATTVFGEIQDSINMIWGLKVKPKRGWLKMLQNRFLSFSVIISLGFLLLVSLALSSIIEGISNRLQMMFPDVTVIIFYIINLILTIGVSMLIFGVIFKVLPDAHIRWKDVIVGAIVTAVLFLIGKFAISVYVSQTKVGSTYGAAGSLVILLVWIYYSSIILYLGAEFTKAYAIKYGAAILPDEYAVTTKQVVVEMGQKSIQEKESKDASSIIKNQNS
ncbi:MAG: YihY/virulence factor BrkB family protein [Flavipsychrobacter sp.]